jgi:ATP-dependent Lon protease
MLTIPVYNIILVPGVIYYFQNEYFKELLGGENFEKGEELAFLMIKEDKDAENLNPEDFYPIGLSAVIEEIGKEEIVSVRSMQRINIEDLQIDKKGKISFDYSPREEINDLDEEEEKKRLEDVKSAYIQYVSEQQWGILARNYVNQWKSMGEMVASISTKTDIPNEERYAILAADRISERTALMEKVLYEFLQMARVGNEAESEAAEQNEQLYREDAIKRQIEYLQRELDEMHPENISDVRRFEKKIKESGMNEQAEAEAKKVLLRMKQEGQNSPEYGMLYDYLDFVCSLSWKKAENREIDLKQAEEILEEDHYGLKKPKKRILQQIAVMTLNKKQSGSILLFVGAPGTGKTSICQSIAKALGRSYVRVSLGGIRDEAEIRGHRRTYIGAMPGRIMDGMKKSDSSNPVMVLDEVDKLSHDYSGDPSSALLEVLDPEQNFSFTDHYMNTPYDLSDVLFICTANSTEGIPEPLLNRMEIIDFAGYTASEKFQIAKKHLIPRSMKEMGLKKKQISFTDEAIEQVISDYTMESGVRGLKKCIDAICRSAAVLLVRGEQKSITVNPKRLKELIDAKPILHDRILKEKKAGVVTGLAWTMAGGEILYIESVMMKGEGKLIVTGQLGDVMKESIQIALSLVKLKFPEKAELFEKNDIHIHVPEGAIPKDGPSAGITMTTALSSLVCDKAVDPHIAMTGEVSLRGAVMPIGGLPEKLMAAVRAGVTRVFIPKGNVQDLEDVAEEVKEALEIIPVEWVDEVLKKTGIL